MDNEIKRLLWAAIATFWVLIFVVLGASSNRKEAEQSAAISHHYEFLLNNTGETTCFDPYTCENLDDYDDYITNEDIIKDSLDYTNRRTHPQEAGKTIRESYLPYASLTSVIPGDYKNGKVSVYICTGPQSKRYHRTIGCRGLKNCSGEIRKVSLAEAKDKYYRTPCGYCYK